MSRFENTRTPDPSQCVFDQETTTLLNALCTQILILPPEETFAEANAIECFQSFCKHDEEHREKIWQRLARFADFLEDELNKHFHEVEARITGTYNGANENEQIAQEIARRLSESLPETREFYQTPPHKQVKNMMIIHSALIELSRNICRVGELIQKGVYEEINESFFFNLEAAEDFNFSNLSSLTGYLALLTEGEKRGVVNDTKEVSHLLHSGAESFYYSEQCSLTAYDSVETAIVSKELAVFRGVFANLWTWADSLKKLSSRK